MYKTSTLSVQGLMTELMRFTEQGMTGPFVVCVYDALYNPHDALAAKNIIEMFPNVDIRVAIMAGNTSGALLIAAAVEEDKRYLTSQGIFAFSSPDFVGHGAYKDLNNAAVAQTELRQRMNEILDKAFNLPRTSEEMHKEKELPRAPEVMKFGFRPLEELTA
ncbi:hypothetical protein CZP2022_184 [Vibrio phage C-ZP2022]|nr:hypothetical protein CZP2022_184 [Vibrio phage C-ZP2022]